MKIPADFLHIPLAHRPRFDGVLKLGHVLCSGRIVFDQGQGHIPYITRFGHGIINGMIYALMQIVLPENY